MKRSLLSGLLVLFLAAGCAPAKKEFKVGFDSRYEVAGQKFALRDINPDLPGNWDGYNFVVVEFRVSTSQRFHVGFTTDYGYNELRWSSYVPGAWNRIAVPLKFYRSLPDARVDLAATFNQPRNLGWINLGGRRGELHGVDSIGIRMRAPIGDPTFEIRSITLAIDDPGDLYLGEGPVIDGFGQHGLVDYPEKIKSLEQLEAEWKAEEEDLANLPDYNYSRWGGYKQKQVRGTGFFRVEKVDGRWWMVDPDGYLFLSHGVDCVDPERGGNIKDLDARLDLMEVLPPERFINENRTGGRSASYRTWNLFRRFGEEYAEKAADMTVRRMERWGLNTIAAWSSPAVYGLNRKAHTLNMQGIGIDGSLMGLADVYASDFASKMDESMRSYMPAQKDNPWVLGYFVGNEPSWLGQEARLCDLILEGGERPIKAALQKFLADGGDTPQRRKEFVYDTFETFMQTVRATMKRHDPNHLNLGIRFGNLNELDERLMEICRDAFDVMSFNCYMEEPDRQMMDRALMLTDRPLIIGEYHFGTVDRGMAQSLWQVDSEEQRAIAYRWYTERGYSHPGLVGTAWFQWIDQDIMGRGDGENYNCGLFDVTDRPYKPLVEAVSATALNLYEVHAGTRRPFNEKPARARGHGGIPDLWNE